MEGLKDLVICWLVLTSQQHEGLTKHKHLPWYLAISKSLGRAWLCILTAGIEYGEGLLAVGLHECCYSHS